MKVVRIGVITDVTIVELIEHSDLIGEGGENVGDYRCCNDLIE